MPKNPEFAVEALAISDGVDGQIDSQELLVLRDDLDQRLLALVEQNEILEEVDEIGLGADALEQGLHIDGARLLFG